MTKSQFNEFKFGGKVEGFLGGNVAESGIRDFDMVKKNQGKDEIYLGGTVNKYYLCNIITNYCVTASDQTKKTSKFIRMCATVKTICRPVISL